MIRAILLSSCLLAAAVPQGAGAEQLDLKRYIPLSEIRDGMEGIGLTVVSGGRTSQFQVKVLGVLHGWGPGQSAIVVRCSGMDLERTGVSAGMSGSPIYFDGRLAGALAFAWPFSKEPIAGIQPIEHMLEISDARPEKLARTGAAGGGSGLAAGVRLGEREYRRIAIRGSADHAGADADTLIMQPVATPLMVSGAPQGLEGFLDSFCRKHGFVRVQAAGAVGKPPEAEGGKAGEKEPVRLVPGGVLCIRLLEGDLDISAMGTVTDVIGDRVLGFGHHFFGLGEAGFPVASGEVVSVISRQSISFKLGAPLETLGTMTRDEKTGILCRLGGDPGGQADISLAIRGPRERDRREYRYRATDHRIVAGDLAAMSTMNSLKAWTEPPRYRTLSYRFEVTFRDYPKPLVLSNTLTGQTADPRIALALYGAIQRLADNVYRDLHLADVKGEILVEDRDRRVEILDAETPRTILRPGETIPIVVVLRGIDERPFRETLSYTVPADLAEGRYDLMVCDAGRHLDGLRAEQPHYRQHHDIDGLFQMVRLDAPTEAFYLRLAPRGAGLAVGKEVLPELPDSVRTIIRQADAEVCNYAAARVETVPSKHVVAGWRTLTLTIDREARPPIPAAQ